MKTRCFFQNFKYHSRLGFTLLELLIVLGSITVISSGTWVAYQISNRRSETKSAIQGARTLSNTLMQTYGRTGSFANLDTQSVINGQLAPANLPVVNHSLTNPWGGSVTVAPSSTGSNAFSLTFKGVPSDGCVNMASQLSPNFEHVNVNNTSVGGIGQSVNIGLATQLCFGNKNTIMLTSNTVATPTTGGVLLPVDHGAPPPLPIPPPSTLGAASVAPVKAVTAQMADSTTQLKTFKIPTVSAVSVTGVPASVSRTITTSIMTPTTALPPQTCFPSVTQSTATSIDYGYQTLACQVGYAGSISQQQTRTKSIVTTTTKTCATLWSTPSVSRVSASPTYGAWGAWTTIANSCAAMCSTQLPSYAVQHNYQWVTINIGCPAGYSGTNSYQALQVQSNSPYCPNPSATSSPVYAGWSGWSNTGTTQNAIKNCHPNVTPPPTPSIASAMWGVNIDVSPSSTATSYQIGISCQLNATGPVISTIQNVPVAGLPSTSSNPNPNRFDIDTFTPAYRIGGIGETTSVPGVNEISAMTAALPQSQCKGFLFPLSTTAWVRACNSSGCSGWTSKPQFCNWNLC